MRINRIHNGGHGSASQKGRGDQAKSDQEKEFKSLFDRVDQAERRREPPPKKQQMTFHFSASISVKHSRQLDAPASKDIPCPGLKTGLLAEHNLKLTTALHSTLLQVTQLMQALTRDLFALMQPIRDIASWQVPSSFAAACPHGGGQTSYGTPGGNAGPGYTADDVPDGHPEVGYDGAYRPGSGCPVMGGYTGDGAGGGVDGPLRRLFEADYGDGKGTMAGADRPGAREISNTVAAATGDTPSARGATDLFWGWGQFLDHDLSLSEGGAPDPQNIPVPKGDPKFDPGGTGDKELAFHRTPGEADAQGVRQQHNAITPEIDGSNVYGSTPEQEARLREGVGGRMRLDDRGNLPRDENGFFLAGDVRVNENPLLTSFHTVFVREHNRLADELAKKNPCWSDDKIFKAARKINVAQMQAITMNEFLPVLLGPDALGEYDGYTGVDPQISNAFSTAAYRFGHTMVSDHLLYIDDDGNETQIPLKDAFFNPGEILDHGIDDILRGGATQRAQEMDTELVDSLRDALMTGPRAIPLDLASLNIQRGRDHGLPSLNDMKRALGQTPLTGFDDPRLRDGVGERLAQVYDTIDQVDAWLGMLAEKPLGDGLAGETQAAVLVDQFRRSRDGDPDWYERKLPARQIAEINQTTLADIIERNVKDTDLQDYAMLSHQHQPATGYS